MYTVLVHTESYLFPQQWVAADGHSSGPARELGKLADRLGLQRRTMEHIQTLLCSLIKPSNATETLEHIQPGSQSWHMGEDKT